MSGRGTYRPGLPWSAAAIVAAGLAGCGDAEPERSGVVTIVASPPVATASAPPARPTTTAAGTTALRPRPRTPQRPPTQTLADGTIHRPAPLPTSTHVPAENECVPRRLRSLEGSLVLRIAPPRPGLSARVAGDDVVVELDTGRPPDDCRPVRVRLTIINSRREYQVIGPMFAIARLGPQTITVPVPDGFSAPPDVVRATLTTDRGAGGDTTSVLVRP